MKSESLDRIRAAIDVGYTATEEGEIFSPHSNQPLKRLPKGPSSAFHFYHKGKIVAIQWHYFVWMYFRNPLAEDEMVEFIDKDRTNIRMDNLRAVKRKGRPVNPKRKYRGEQMNTAKLKESEVVEARQRRSAGESYIEIQKTFPHISVTALRQAIIGDTWKHLPQPNPSES